MSSYIFARTRELRRRVIAIHGRLTEAIGTPGHKITTA